MFFGGQAVGAFGWGLLAERVGLVPTFLAAAVATGLGAATIWIWPLIDTERLDRNPAVPWPEPELAVEPHRLAGPVVVEVTYTVPAENEPALMAELDGLRRSRMRTGAVQWGMFRVGEVPGRMVEVYVVATWDEHLRQHRGRLTGADAEVDRRVRELSAEPPRVSHLLPADAVLV